MKNTRVLLLFFIITTIVSAIFGLLSNLVANSVPETWKPYFLPAFIISLLLLIALGVWQVWAENRPEQPKPEKKPAYFHEGWFLKHYYLAQDDFTGRKSELGFLTNWLQNKDSKPLLVLLALGGFGKSALVWHWLNNEVVPKGLSKVVWWGFYDDNSFDTFVRETLEYLDIDPKTLSLYDQVEMLARYIHQNKILIVMDGFERALRAYSSMNAAYQGDEENKSEVTNNQCVSIHAGRFLQRVAALNAQGRVLLTTRLLPDDLKIKQSGNLLAGCLMHDLDKMSKEDAVAFFRKQNIKGTHAEIETACEFYGYHPLSLRLLAGRIVKDYSRDIKLAEKFKIDTDLKGRQNHILKVAYYSLPRNSRLLISKIAAFRSPMSFDSIKIFEAKPNGWTRFLFGLQDLQTVLNDFVERGLLHHDPNKDKYDLHPIVRRYTYERLTASDRTAAHTRLRDYFAAVDIPEQIKTLEDLAPVIELYYHSLRAGDYEQAFRLLYDRLVPNPLHYQLGAYQLIIELDWALFPNGKDKPPGLKDETKHAWLYNSLANSFSMSGQPGQALPLFEKQIAIRETQEMKLNLAVGLGNLSHLAQLPIGALTEAEQNQRRAINLCLEIKDKFQENVHHQELGRLLSYRGSWREAEQELAISTNYWEQTNDVQGVCMDEAYRALCFLFMSREDSQSSSQNRKSAIQAASRALELAQEDERQRKYPHPRDYIRAYWLLGAGYRAHGDLTKAEENLSRAISMCRQINMVDHEANILLDLTRLRYDQKNYEEAKSLADEALLITERCGYVLQGADVNLFLAQYALEQEKDKVKAKEYAETALKLATCDGPPYYYKVAYEEAERFLAQLKG